MSCQKMCELLDGYVDGELDGVTTLQFERHFEECTSCHALYQRYEEFTRIVQAHLPRFDAPAGLEGKIRSKLGLKASSFTRIAPSGFADWHRWAVAASLVGVLVLTGTPLRYLNIARPRNS